VTSMNDILCEINHGSVISLASLDVSAAFDTVCHKTALQHVENEFGIDGRVKVKVLAFCIATLQRDL
jgi:hypothetical protein